MLRKLITCLAVVTFFLTISAPGYADDRMRSFNQPYDPFSNFGRRPEVVGGVYLRIPFTGGMKQRKGWRRDEPRVGFAFGAQLPGMIRHDDWLSPRAPHFVDLSMGFSGPKSTRLNGIYLFDQRIMRANEGEEGEEGDKKDKSNAGKYVWYGLAIVGGVVLIVLAAYGVGCATDNGESYVCP